MASIYQICIPAAGGTFQKAQEMRMSLMNMKEREGAQKYLRKNCYYRIKFTVTIFLTTFMWRRHLNSKTLVTTTHKKLGEVSNGTCTQVISQTIDKYRVKMIQRELYKVKNPLWKGIGKILERRITSLLTIVCKKRSIHIKAKLLRLKVCSYLSPRIESLFPFISEV